MNERERVGGKEREREGEFCCKISGLEDTTDTLPLVSVEQARAQALSKQLADTHDQVEQARVELETFKQLQSIERLAIPQRLEVTGCFANILALTYFPICTCTSLCVCSLVCYMHAHTPLLCFLLYLFFSLHFASRST